MYTKLVKRVLDVISAFLGLIILSPIIILILVILGIINNGSPFFYQDRPGKESKIFKIIKFKTMTDAKNKEGCLLSDTARLTFAGKIIRKTSLDELPQLINVIKGDMSFVGPRPLLVEYLPLYNEKQSKRHDVKPGITGWAQINGRNALSWEEKFELDIWYVNNQSFLLDMKILFLTILKVLRRDNINNKNHVTMPVFKGTKND